MTAAPTPPRSRVVVAVGALLAALVLALLPLPPATTAAAAEGAEDSAVTRTGKKGKYDDFSDLRVTVHQTRGLRSQGVRVSWEGGAPTKPSVKFNVDYLQIMQCWGDGAAGPDREQCAFGAGTSEGAGAGRSVEAVKDPEEKEYTGENAFVPFRPADGQPATTSLYDFTYFGPLDTNEQKAVRTFDNGTGEVEFELQDGNQANHLGCGENTAPAGGTPDPRHCWLVVVPRGTHEADGSEKTNPQSDALQTSPLSTTNWAQRIVFRLDFLPVDQFCPEGQPERAVPGSELADDAVASWGPKLCSSTGSTFVYNRASEESARNEVMGASRETPAMGVTVDPVVQPGDGPGVVHAPVAVTGLAVAFFIEGPSGVVRELRLTPRLVAKMLTHSYVRDVPLAVPTPEQVKGNPDFYTSDPEFRELNPRFPELVDEPRSLMVPLLNSDTTRVVWNWLQSDKEAREFLAGEADPWGMRVNSYFQDLSLAENGSLTDFPKADPTTAVPGGFAPEGATYSITDLDPYTADLHDGAVKTRRGNNGRTIQWDVGATPPRLTNDAPLPGRHAVMAIVDAASAVRYGLQTAALRNADGTFVKPAADTFQAAVSAMRTWPDHPDVLKADPARAEGQAYPLTAVAYAAASVNQDAKDREAYADFIRFAAGPGQTPGLSAGQLPPGYAPLTAKLRAQAETAADDLEKGVAQGDPTPGPGGAEDPGGLVPGAGTGGTSSGTGAGGTSAGGAGGGGTDPSAPESAAPNGSAPASSGPQQNVADAEQGFTPGDVLGIIRWVLLVVLFLGGAAGLAGPIMLRLAGRRTRTP
ncbi:hypothetical protein ACFVGN_24550 [Streptomyces sp. NPDC057757]|uniref:hypothetical protein n=1 Tax=Streptomyces sp. NPDC057757 TaxID=3346241 RepID=UPI0036CA85CE